MRSPAAPPATSSIWNAAVAAFSTLVALALPARCCSAISPSSAIIDLTLRMMADIAADAFHRVQRFSTDWHANTFAGSTVRKVTRGMWALDLLNDTILVALFPSMVMLVGSTVLLGWYWPVMGLIVAVGSLVYCALTVALSLGYVAPAAQPRQCLGHPARRLARRRHQLQRGGQGVWRGGARGRPLREGRRQVARPHAPHLGARHHQRHRRRAPRCWCCASPIIGFALLLWSRGQATPATSPSC